MATKDITRFLHQPKKHYSAVRLQQGRPLLDSDFNEGVRLEEEDRKGTLVQLFGPSASTDQGFTIGRPVVRRFDGVFTALKLRPGNLLPVQEVTVGGVAVNVYPLSIRPGSFYLGGMRFEQGQAEPFAFQRGFLQMRAGDLPPVEASPSPSPFSPSSPASPQFPPFHYFYYLNAWEQAVTGVEDDEFTERALSGPDTTVRIRRMRRVEVLTIPEGSVDTCAEAWEFAIQRLEAENGVFDRDTNELRSRGRLGLAFQTFPTGECAPCTPDPGQKYLGSENQTLRVMLTSPTTFVWALDNAAPLYRVEITGLSQDDPTEVRVKMLTPPRDEEHEPKRNRVVEILPFGALLEDGEGERKNDPHFLKVAAEVGAFTRVADDYDDESQSFTIDTEVGLAAIQNLVHRWDKRHPAATQLNYRRKGSDARFFYVRFWHVADRTEEVELPTTNDPSYETLGDTGVVPLFHQPGRRGDYWVASLRIDQRERIVPYDLLSEPGGVPPHGPRHFYAPLSLVDGDNVAVTRVEDCRPALRPITDRGCATYTVGDGLLSRGDFDNIREAVDALPAEGGLISLLPGNHRLPDENGLSLAITGRTGVVIEGCGEATLIEATESSPADPLLSFTDCTGLTLSNLRLHVADQVGIKLQNCTSTTISDVTVVAGNVTMVSGDPVFAPGSSLADDRLVEATGCTQLSLRRVVIESQRRPGLLVLSSQDVALAELRCFGQESPFGPAAEAMITLEQVERVRVRDCSLDTFAQVGVYLDGRVEPVRDVRMSGLSISSGPFLGSPDIPALTAVDVDQCQDVSLERSQITLGHSDTLGDHAGVVLRGNDIVLEGNQILCQSSAPWGGVQIRGGSERIELRENRIAGGHGHGITLGSVRWVEEEFDEDSSPNLIGLKEIARRGAGAGQTIGGQVTGMYPDVGIGDTEPTDGPPWAQDEGRLSDVLLSDNRIEGMGSNGISALTVLGLRQVSFNGAGGSGPEIEVGEIAPMTVSRLVIERNTVSGNVQSPTLARGEILDSPRPGVGGTSSPAVPEGGYPVLTALPQGGIVLGLVDNSDVRENVVIGNGAQTSTPVNGVFIFGGNRLVVSDNRIADNGLPARPESPSELDVDVRAGLAVLLAGASTTTSSGAAPNLEQLDELTESGSNAADALDRASVALQVLNNTIRQPEGRALHVVAVGPLVVDGNFLASRGHHHDDAIGFGDVVFALGLSGATESKPPFSIGGSPVTNPFSSYPAGVLDYLGDGSTNGISVNGIGGQLLFNNNQVTYDWNVELPGSGSFAPVAIMTRDHLSLASNQFALRIQADSPSNIAQFDQYIDEPVAAHVFAVGGTINATRNRFSEEVGGAHASLYTMGRVQNITAHNQSTHEIAAQVWDDDDEARYLLDAGNQVMFPRQDGTSVPDNVSEELRTFFRFVWPLDT